MRWLLAFAVALANDIIDILGPGTIPVAGDVLDIASTAVLLPLVRDYRFLITISELIPAADPLPIYTLVTLWTYLRRRHANS